MWTTGSTLGDVFRRSAHYHPTRMAVIFEDERSTYRELDELSIRIGASLIELGVQYRDRVGIFMQNSVELVATFLAAARIGAAIVPLNTRLRGSELRAVIDSNVLTALITHRTFDTDDKCLVDRLNEAGENMPSATAREGLHDHDHDGRLVIELPELPVPTDVSFRMVENRHLQVRIRDVAIVLPTSGTTSAPKGCVLSHE